VDGPEFDASLVNFEVLMQRNTMYRDKECESLKHFEENKEEELAKFEPSWPRKRNASARELAEEKHYVCFPQKTPSAQRAHEDSAHATCRSWTPGAQPQL
jgi:hypothetical protein